VDWVVVQHTNEVCMKFTARPLTPDLWPALEDLSLAKMSSNAEMSRLGLL